jgi:hypothetical protein
VGTSEAKASDAPVSKIRQTVRAGRDRMRAHRLSWLPEDLAGARILDGHYMTVQQAIGTGKQNEAAAKWLAEFVEDAKRSGLVARFIEQHKVKGLSVAPLA